MVLTETKIVLQVRRDSQAGRDATETFLRSSRL
jgi:hypothetical protein